MRYFRAYGRFPTDKEIGNMMDITKEEMEGIKKLLDTIHEAAVELIALGSKVKIQKTKRDAAIEELDRVRAAIDYGHGPLFEKQEEETEDKEPPAEDSDIQVIEVEAERIAASGDYLGDEEGRTASKDGDIFASVSCGAIAEGKIKKPFEYEDVEYVGVSSAHSGEVGTVELEAYRVEPSEEFDGEARKYADVGDFEVLREQPEGFYHGMLVEYRKKEYVLVGPPVTFVPKKATEDVTPRETSALKGEDDGGPGEEKKEPVGAGVPTAEHEVG